MIVSRESRGGGWVLYKKKGGTGGRALSYASHVDISSITNPLPSFGLGGSTTRAQTAPVNPIVAPAYTPPVATQPIGGAITTTASLA